MLFGSKRMVTAEVSPVNIKYFTSTESRPFDFEGFLPASESFEFTQRLIKLLGPNTFMDYPLDGTDSQPDQKERLIITRPYDEKSICVHLVEPGSVAGGPEVNLLNATSYISQGNLNVVQSNGSSRALEKAIARAEAVYNPRDLNLHPVENVMVAGFSGTVGSQLTLELRRRGFRPFGVDQMIGPFTPSLDENDRYIGDLTDTEFLKTLPWDQTHAIVLLAAEPEVHKSTKDPTLAFESLILHQNIMEEARKRGIPVFFSGSREAYGPQPHVLITEDMVKFGQAESPYAWAKKAGIDLMELFHRLYGLHTVTGLYSNVVSPGENRRSRVLCVWADLASRGEDLIVFGADKVFTFTYITDTCNGSADLICAIRSPVVSGETFNVCGNQYLTLGDVARAVQQHFETRIPQGKLILKPMRPGEIGWFKGSPQKAKEAVGYVPVVNVLEKLPEVLDSLITD